MTRSLRSGIALGVGMALLAGCAAPNVASVSPAEPTREEPFVKRPFRPASGGRWIGEAISYGPFRDGQRPGGLAPGPDELREDLLLMTRHWNLLRVYGAAGPTETLLEVIRAEDLDMKVMLGLWIDAEEPPGARDAVPIGETKAANRREVETAIRLAAKYPEIVLAVCVGNETQVSWSSHRVPPGVLIRTVREVRARTVVPVTVADDFNFWNKPESEIVARELDFLVIHIHPLWNGRQLDDAVQWTRSTFAEVRSVHPRHTLVLGETGWATRMHDEGEQARLIKGQPGEEEQRLFRDALNAWTREERVPTFFFEAFDENWKGGEHPDEVEKHWGLYRADRTPKRALAGGE